jgi:hypothetical protein
LTVGIEASLATSNGKGTYMPQTIGSRHEAGEPPQAVLNPVRHEVIQASAAMELIPKTRRPKSVLTLELVVELGRAKHDRWWG